MTIEGEAIHRLQSVEVSVEVSVEAAWTLVLEDQDITPDPTVFPELSGADTVELGEEWLEELRGRTFEHLRDTLYSACVLSVDDLMEFDRRFSWLSERYRISDGEVRDRRFGVQSLMPGDLVETNADTTMVGRAEWSFSIRDLLDGNVNITATSRVIRGRR